MMTAKQQQQLDNKLKEDWIIQHPYEVWVSKIGPDGVDREVFDSRFTNEKIAISTAEQRRGEVR